MKNEEKVKTHAKPEGETKSPIQLEPVLNGNEPKWLAVKYDHAPTPIDNTPVEELVADDAPLPLVPTFDIYEQGKWRCRKCGGTQIDMSGKPEVCTSCDRASTFDAVTEIINPDLWKLPKWKDIPVDELDMLGTYNDMVSLCKKCLIFVEDIQYKIYVLWIIGTYKLGSWNTVGFPFFKGLHDSGKSKGLDIIRELGWRMVPAANCTFVALVRLADSYNAGVLIDEVQNKLSNRTERGQILLEFIKPGYRRGTTYTAGDKDNVKKVVTYKNYSFRSLAGEILHDKAMESRCITFEMEKDFPEIEEIGEAQDEFDRLQTILLNYKYKTTDPPKLPEDFKLHGRTREIYTGIIRTGMHIGLDVEDVVEYALREEEEKKYEMQNSIERDILQIIYNIETQTTLDDAPEEIYLKEICLGLGWGEDGKDKQKLGYILKGKGMGLTRYRDWQGKKLKLQDPKTKRKLIYLYKRYGVTEWESNRRREES